MIFRAALTPANQTTFDANVAALQKRMPLANRTVRSADVCVHRHTRFGKRRAQNIDASMSERAGGHVRFLAAVKTTV